MGKIKDPGDGTFQHFTGEHMILRQEPAIVKAAVRKLGLELNEFKLRITGIYSRPRPIGFDFYCDDSQALLKAAKGIGKLREDDRATISGKFVAFLSHGHSFRQTGSGGSVHLIIALNGWCNVHIDTAGFATSCGYDALRALGHGYFDLAADLLPGAFVSFGDSGVAGVMVAPMKGLDGKTRMIFGIGGRF